MASTVTKTVGPGGGYDYTNLVEWYNAEKKDLVAADEVHIVECYGGNCLAAASGALTFTNGDWTTDPTRYIEIRPANGEGHEGVWNTSKAYLLMDGDHCIEIPGGVAAVYLRLTQLQMKTTGGSVAISCLKTGTGVTGINNNTQLIVDRCIAINEAAGGVSNVPFYLVGGGVTNDRHVFKNNIVIDNKPSLTSRRGFRCDDGSSDMQICFFNNTVIASGGDHCFERVASLPAEFQNNYLCSAVDPYEDFSGSAGSNDATSTADAPNATYRNIPYDENHFVSVTPGSENLHLVDSANNKLKRGGADLSQGANSDETIDEDIDGDSRFTTAPAGSGVFDIGADQLPITLPTASGGVGGYVDGEPKGSGTWLIGGYIDAQGNPVGNFIIGAYVNSEAEEGSNHFGIMGGAVSGDGGVVPAQIIGGYVDAVPKTDVGPIFIGGGASGLNTDLAVVGCEIFGRADYSEYAEEHARVLVKANDADAAEQKLEIDAVIILKQEQSEDFNARFIVSDTARSEFNAKVTVGKYKSPPTATITNVTASGDGNLGVDNNVVTVTFDGNLVDGYEFNNAYIDFGDPVNAEGIYNDNASISGFSGPGPWTASHTYTSSGIYHITVRAVDNNGFVGMDVQQINMASGLVAGTDYAYIDISGVPRIGEVPPSLNVDFTLATSGSIGVSSPTDPNLYWTFGNLERSQKKNPSTYYSSPGRYVVIARYKYNHPAGSIVWSSDTLRVGYNT